MMARTAHNHLTRVILAPGKCPGCDEYFAQQPTRPPERDILTRGIEALDLWETESDYPDYIRAQRNILTAALKLVTPPPDAGAHSFDAGPGSQVGLAVALAAALAGETPANLSNDELSA